MSMFQTVILIFKKFSPSFLQVEYKEVGDGNGYVSKVFKIDVYFTDGGKPHSVVLKVPCLQAFEKINFLRSINATAEEVGLMTFFYIFNTYLLIFICNF